MTIRTRSKARKTRLYGIIGSLGLLVAVWAANAAPPLKITADVASIADLTAESQALLTSIEQSLATEESYNGRREPLRRQAIQIAIFAQALAEHDGDSPEKRTAPGLRDSALGLARAMSFDEASQALPSVKAALAGQQRGTPTVEADWGKLARAGTLMHVMKERSEAIRRGLRRPKDPEVESRHATAIALMILVVHGDTHAVKSPVDKQAWQDICLELQGHMSLAAAAIKTRDNSAADHFRLGMEACDKCHQKFKP